MSKSEFKVHIRAPINQVWTELTSTTKVQPFFYNTRCETPGLKRGAPVRWRSANGKYTAVAGEVLEIDGPHRYAHSFKFTSLNDPPCKITYVLEKSGDGVDLTLINENVPPGTKTEKYMTQGGQFIVDNLKAVLETGKPTFGGRFALLMMKLMQPFSPKASLSVNWP